MAHALPSELWLKIINLLGAQSPKSTSLSLLFPSPFRPDEAGLVYDTAALSSFSMVHKFFRRLTLPLMYKNLVFRNPYCKDSSVSNGWPARRAARAAARLQLKVVACKERIDFLRTHHHLTPHVHRVDLLYWNHMWPPITSDHFLDALTTFDALERVVESLPSLKTVIIDHCDVSEKFYRAIFSSHKLQGLRLINCWSEWGSPYLPVNLMPQLVSLQELCIDPWTVWSGTTLMESPIYQLLVACSSSLRSLALTIISRGSAVVHDIVPNPWPHMIRLEKLTLHHYISGSSGHITCQSLIELLKSHPTVENLVFITHGLSSAAGEHVARCFQLRLFADPTVLPRLRSFSGGDITDACSVVPNRPVQDISINYISMFSAQDISFTPLAQSAVPVTHLHLGVYMITLDFATQLAGLSSELPYIEVLVCVGHTLRERKQAKSIRKLFMRELHQWAHLQECHINLRSREKKIFTWKGGSVGLWRHPVLLRETDRSKRGHPTLERLALLCTGEWVWLASKGQWVYRRAL